LTTVQTLEKTTFKRPKAASHKKVSKKVRPNYDQQAYDAYVAGAKVSEIAKDLGIHERTVRSAIKRVDPDLQFGRDVIVRGTALVRRRKFDHEAAYNDYITGSKITALIKKYKVSGAAIWYAIKTQNPRLKSEIRGRPRTFDYNEALKLVRAGKSFTEVGKRFNVTDETVKKAVFSLDPSLRRTPVVKEPVLYWNPAHRKYETIREIRG